MNPEFEIVSYVGAKPLLFGMTELQAEKTVGNPLSKNVDELGETNGEYGSFCIRYSAETGSLVEVGFSSDAILSFRGIKLFDEPDAFSKIVRMDSCPWESHGFVVLLDLGMTLTGFHDNDKSQLGVTVFRRGRWDKLKGQFKKLRFP